MPETTLHYSPEAYSILIVRGIKKTDALNICISLQKISEALEEQGHSISAVEIIESFDAANLFDMIFDLRGKHKDWIEEAAGRMLFEMLNLVESHITLLANHLLSEVVKFDQGVTYKPDEEICRRLSIDPSSKTGYLTMFIRPALIQLKKEYIEASKKSEKPMLNFKEMLFQMCDCKEQETLKAIRGILVENQHMYSDDEWQCLDKVYQSRKLSAKLAG